MLNLPLSVLLLLLLKLGGKSLGVSASPFDGETNSGVLLKPVLAQNHLANGETYNVNVRDWKNLLGVPSGYCNFHDVIHLVLDWIPK